MLMEMNKTKKGWKLLIRFILANIGFLLSFAVLLLVAIYEEDLATLIK